MLWGCRLLFHFLSESLIFTPNPGLYMPMFLCSFTNGNIVFSDILECSTILSNPLRWVRTLERHPIHPSGGGWHENRGRGGFKWVSSCKCAQCNFGAKYLLRQTQCQSWRPLWFKVPQGTWGSSSVDCPGLRPHDRNCDLAGNPACDMRNGCVHVRGHDSTQSGKYD